MAMISCPECGNRISDKALSCPQCGYTSENAMLPIAAQEQVTDMTLYVQFAIENYSTKLDLSCLSHEQKKSFFDAFGNWERISAMFPSLARNLQEMFTQKHLLVAQFSNEIKRMLASGEFSIARDRDNNYLAYLINNENSKIAMQLRLEDMTYYPNLTAALNQMSTMALMRQTLQGIDELRGQIQGLHLELHEDRIALLEAAKDQYDQADKTKSLSAKSTLLLNAAHDATVAKRQLMHEYMRAIKYVLDNQDQAFLRTMSDRGKSNTNAKEGMEDLAWIMNAVQIEVKSLYAMGEPEAAEEALLIFGAFIKEQHLDNRDTLLTINSSLDNKQPEFIEDFLANVQSVMLTIERLFPNHPLLEDHDSTPEIEQEEDNEDKHAEED